MDVFIYLTIPLSVTECANIIRSSKKPVMIIGSQATLPPITADETRISVQKIGIPVFLGGMARGLLGEYIQNLYLLFFITKNHLSNMY